MRSIGEILKEERTRLGMNQDEFSAVGGLKRRALTLYEQNVRSPDAAYLRELASVGVDVQYILTGEQAASALAQHEKEILLKYRSLNLRDQNCILAMVDVMISQPDDLVKDPIKHPTSGRANSR